MKIHIESDGTPGGTKVTDAETGGYVVADRLSLEMDLSSPRARVRVADISNIEVVKINGYFDASESELLRLRGAVMGLFHAARDLNENLTYEEFVNQWEFREQARRRREDEARKEVHPPLRPVK